MSELAGIALVVLFIFFLVSYPQFKEMDDNRKEAARNGVDWSPHRDSPAFGFSQVVVAGIIVAVMIMLGVF